MALQDEFPNVRYSLGVALEDAGRYDEAKAQLQAVMKAEPEDAGAYNSLGCIAHAQRRPQQAVDYFQRAIALQPEYAQADFKWA